jgi:hypothetical protein
VRIAASQHQTKAAPFLRALLEHGHEFVVDAADVFLLDIDTKWNAPLYEPRLERGEKVFLYPHAPHASYLYDGCIEADQRVTAHFVVSEGVREVYRRIGMTVPTYAVGFPWCELRPFRTCDEPRKVLFAPEHPLGNGYMRPAHRDRNTRVFEALLELDVELTVRHIMSAEQNGLYPVGGVTFVEAQPDNGTAQIDEADAVVAVGTFASLAIARGVPTIMFDQSEPLENDNPDGTTWVPAHWERYGDYVRYPYDFTDGPLGQLLSDACASDARIAEWRERHIGEQFDPSAFATLVRELCREPILEDEVRDQVVVTFADEIVRRPDLLARYAGKWPQGESTTLVVYAPDAEETEIVPQLQAAIERSGVAEPDLPDMLLTALPRHEVHERTIARRACAILSGGDVDGPLADLPDALGAQARVA